MTFITSLLAGLGAMMSGLVTHIASTLVKAFEGLFLVFETTGVAPDQVTSVAGISNLGYAVIVGLGIALTYGAVYLIIRQFKLRSK